MKGSLSMLLRLYHFPKRIGGLPERPPTPMCGSRIRISNLYSIRTREGKVIPFGPRPQQPQVLNMLYPQKLKRVLGGNQTSGRTQTTAGWPTRHTTSSSVP